mmetsp:Transcript_19544/g.32452  ORF Transcript_19544/g.32452 Transcript_19544/m.32452 type:complete len:193 (+) Transcript_19544:46-624(+)
MRIRSKHLFLIASTFASTSSRAAAASFVVSPSGFLNQSKSDKTSTTSGTTTTARFMSDEVNKAKAAAAEYKSSDTDGAGPATVFDKILSGEWKSDKVYEDDTAYAFRDITPQAPVHILVIPKERNGLTQLTKARADQEGLLGHLLNVAQQVGKKECPDGFRIVINDGEHGAQSVYHLHLHVLGGRQLSWPPG